MNNDSLEERNVYGGDDMECQFKRSYRNTSRMMPADLAATNKKPKSRPAACYTVEKHITYSVKYQYYWVRINLRTLRVEKTGFKSLQSAREFRDEQLANYNPPAAIISRCGSKSSKPSIYLKP